MIIRIRLGTLCLVCGLFLAGCSSSKVVKTATPPTPTPTPTPITAPAPVQASPPELGVQSGGQGTHRILVGSELRGTINTVNAGGKFVVLGFPVGVLPRLDTVFDVLRRGAKIGEVRITGPQRDTFTVADILRGEPTVGDEVLESAAPPK